MDKRIGCPVGQIRIKERCVLKSEVFRPIKSKYGYKELQNIGFYAYRGDGWGDWHRNSKIPGISVVGAYDGYVIFKKQEEAPRGYFSIPDKKLGGYENKIKKGDIKTLKRRIIEES